MEKHVPATNLKLTVDEELFKPVKMPQMKQVLLLPIVGIIIAYGIFICELMFKSWETVKRRKLSTSGIAKSSFVRRIVNLPYIN